MRTFLAVPFPIEIKQGISGIVSSLKSQYPSLKWVSPENYHLTLRFLGEINELQVEKLDQLLGNLVLPKKFDINITQFGAFPSLKNPRVLWLGFLAVEELSKIYNLLEEPIAKSGILLDKKETFKPHLTLARVKNENIKIVSFPEIKLPSFQVREFCLYKSELTPRGPIYSVLKKYFLN